MSPLEVGTSHIDGGPDSAEYYRQQLETVVNNATLALFILDERQHCTYLNPAAEQLTGYTLAEVRGRPLHDIVHHTRPDGTLYPIEECPLDNAFPSNVREEGEEIFVHKDGFFYPVAFTASPLLDRGHPIGTIIEVRDISSERHALEREYLLHELEAYAEDAERARQQAEDARQQAEDARQQAEDARQQAESARQQTEAALQQAETSRQQAEIANRVKGEFLAMVSHELRTPLNAILGYAGLLSEGVSGPLPGQASVMVERIEASARQLHGMIELILIFSQLEAGASQVDLEVVAPAALLTEVSTLLEPLATAKGITIGAGAAEDVPALESDPQWLHQILVNLADNAIKFTDRGEVRLEAEAVGPEVHFRISDTGPGIPTDQLAHIFDPFWQAESGLTRRSTGTGLGLSVARLLAELLGGSLEVSSEVGTGTTFTLRLPLRPPLPDR